MSLTIQRVEIQNFRGFKSRSFEFEHQLTLVHGTSNTGKTALIDALGYGISAIFSGFHKIKSKKFKPVDRHTSIKLVEASPCIEREKKVEITCHAQFDENQLEWKISNSQDSDSILKHSNIHQFSTTLQNRIQAFEEVSLPLILHYGTERYWNFSIQKLTTLEPESRTEGYSNYFSPHKSEKHFLKWLYTQAQSLKVGKPKETYKAFNSIISNLYKEKFDFYYDLSKTRQGLCKKLNNILIPIPTVGDSEKMVFGIIADIAYRCVLLNPQLMGNVFKETSGIVVIDDINLRLTDEATALLLEKLLTLFPKVQFIVSFSTSLSSIKDLPMSFRKSDQFGLIKLINLDDPCSYSSSKSEA